MDVQQFDRMWEQKSFDDFCNAAVVMLSGINVCSEYDLLNFPPSFARRIIESAIYCGNMHALRYISEHPVLKELMSEHDVNRILVYLLSIGQYSLGLKIIAANERFGDYDLIQRRSRDLKLAMEGGVTYFRNANSILDDDYFPDYALDINEEVEDFVGTEKRALAGGVDRPGYWPDGICSIYSPGFVLEDVIVLPDLSVVDERKKLIYYESIKAAQSSWKYTFERNNNFFHSFSRSDHRVSVCVPDLEVVSIDEGFLIPNATDGVGHFIHDALPSLAYYQKIREKGGRPVPILKRNREYDRGVVMHMANFYFDTVLLEAGAKIIRCKKLHVSGPIFIPRLNAYNFDALLEAKSIIDGESASSDNADLQRIYVSRGDGVNNSMGQRDVVDRAVRSSGILEDLGYKVVELSRLSSVEQVELFRRASHVAGVHGAGLMNIVFSKAQSLRVTEILAEPWTYYTIAMFCSGLGFSYQCISPSKVLSGTELSEEGRRYMRERLT